MIDQDAAWQLFGSNDVSGMTVYIGGIPHIVTGVVQRQEGRLTEAAGLDGSLVYVSYQTLSTLGKSNGQLPGGILIDHTIILHQVIA